ncbi:unnamed protein product [Microthlaspi erraticum]|uniref:Uncharacterized protein n=1 Tax=Microthlaspi erraticum TaxID=1685480 RepID=A0A6D2IYP5_9BRAS|nr:unnamed protein product [Microthlaspi erraticum]
MSRTDTERCIYKVSATMRDVKPEAYRPRMALIGLHNRSANPKVAKDGAGTSNDPGLREKSHDDLIMGSAKFTADVKQDLMLLENQLPYFIFDRLFGSYTESLDIKGTVEQFILKFFSLERTRKTNFRHFTDMFRCVYEESLEITPTLNDLSAKAIVKMENADNLSRAGVKFKTFSQMENSESDRPHHGNQQPLESISIRKETDDDYSLRVVFNRGCLVMSYFRAAEDSEIILRNVIAFEQSHAAVKPFTSNYINFLNFLITTEKDVEVLTEEGVLRSGMGSPRLVVEMVNNLNRGLKAPENSQYHNIAINLRAHYKSRRKRCWATLSKVYFSDLLTGTATFAAVFLLFLTLVGTVASVIQACKSFK